jgi:large subunit ribosomal protein L10
MAKTKDQKNQIYSKYKDNVKDYQTMVLLDMNTIKTTDVEKFKNKLAESGSEYVLIKNTIFSKVVKEDKPTLELDKIEGSTGVVFSKEDPSIVLKVVNAFLDENKNSSVKAGIIDDVVYSKENILEIAKLPSREVMIARAVGTMKAPLNNLVMVLTGVQRDFLFTLKAIESKK